MRFFVAASFALTLLLSFAGAAFAGEQAVAKHHRLMLQIDSDDQQLMNLVIGNAMSTKKYFEGKGDTVEIEIVAYGPGINMLRQDKSPVKDHVQELKSAIPNVVLSMCNNSKMAAEKREGHAITPLPGVTIVPAGVSRMVELEEQGWSYVKP